MKIKSAILMALLSGCLSFGGLVFAGDAPETKSNPPQELTQEDCLALAQKGSADIKAAASANKVANANLNFEKSLYFPRLTFRNYTGLTNSNVFTISGEPEVVPLTRAVGSRSGASSDQSSQSFLFTSYENRLEIPVLGDGLFGWKSHKIAKARSSLAQSIVQKDSTTLATRSKVRELFWAAQKAHQEQELFREAVTQNQALLILTREKYGRGLASRKDMLQAEANLAQAQANLEISQFETQRTEQSLLLLIAAPKSSRLKYTPIPQQLPALPPWNDIQGKVPANNLDLKVKKLNIDIAQEDLAVSKNKLWPTVDILARYAGIKAEHNDFQDLFAVYAYLTFPIFDYSIYKDISRKKYSVIEATDSYAATTESTIRTAMDQYKDLQTNRSLAASSQKQIAYLEESYRESKVKFQQNIISFTDLGDALVKLQTAKKNLNEQYFNYQEGYRKLQTLIGEENLRDPGNYSSSSHSGRSQQSSTGRPDPVSRVVARTPSAPTERSHKQGRSLLPLSVR